MSAPRMPVCACRVWVFHCDDLRGVSTEALLWIPLAVRYKLSLGWNWVFPIPGFRQKGEDLRSTELEGRPYSLAAAHVFGDHVFLTERLLLGRPVSQDPRSPQLGDFAWVTSPIDVWWISGDGAFCLLWSQGVWPFGGRVSSGEMCHRYLPFAHPSLFLQTPSDSASQQRAVSDSCSYLVFLCPNFFSLSWIFKSFHDLWNKLNFPSLPFEFWLLPIFPFWTPCSPNKFIS